MSLHGALSTLLVEINIILKWSPPFNTPNTYKAQTTSALGIGRDHSHYSKHQNCGPRSDDQVDTRQQVRLVHDRKFPETGQFQDIGFFHKDPYSQPYGNCSNGLGTTQIHVHVYHTKY